MAAEVASASLPFLDQLARGERRSDRLLWLRIATDYFLNVGSADWRRSGEFLAHFATCLSSADDQERLAVARKLLSRANVSPDLLRLFAELGGETATFVLTHARGLPRDALFTAAFDPVGARAVARRDDLDHELVDTILVGDDAEAIEALAGNLLAPLSADQVREMSNRARRRIGEPAGRRLADRLLARTPIRVETAALFLEATPSQRGSILVAAQRAELGRPRTSAPPSARREVIEQLEISALDGDVERFSAILAETLGCPVALARRIAADRDGEPLAVTLAAIGAPNDVCVRILTAADLRDGANYPRVGALGRLRDVLSPIAARAVVEAILGRAIPRDAPATERAPPIDRRIRFPSIPLAPAVREETASAAVTRRRRAFALTAAERKRDD